MSTFNQPPLAPELFELQRHCRQCTSARGRLHWWRCAAESLSSFLAPRFITLLVAVIVVVGLVVLIGPSLPLPN